MPVTTFMIALAIAGFVEREGYSLFAGGIVVLAFLELFYVNGFLPWWERRCARKEGRTREASHDRA